MNRTMLAVVAAALALLLPLPAGAACRTIKPKKWTGTMSVSNHASATHLAFVPSGCKPPAQLNGTDALIFDVASHRGLKAAAKWTTTTPVKPTQVDGVFYSASCTGMPGTGWHQATAGKSVSFTIPAKAKWLVVTAYTLAPAKDIAVTVSSPGKKCPR